MAFGQGTKIIAFPQPGTSNTPFPVGNLPPFVPVVTTITDTHTAAIIVQTEKLIANFNSEHFKLQAKIAIDLAATLNQLNISIAKLSDVYEGQLKAISDLETMTTVKTSSTIKSNVLAATGITNQIKTNNFGTVINKEKPIVPSSEQQFKESVAEAAAMITSNTVLSALVTFGTNSIERTASLIAGTETYKGISAWLTKQKDVILSAILPPSTGVIASNAASIAGQKIIPGD
jgi:hypothetical protein